MKHLLKSCAALAVLITFSIIAFADVPPRNTPQPMPTPKPAKAVDSNLTIRLVKDAKEARLIIPKSQLKQLRAELEQLDNDTDTAAVSAVPNFRRTQTIVSGLLMSLALIFGGIWLARSAKAEAKVNKTLIIGLVLFLCGTFATLTFANMGPPPEARSITSKLFNRSVFTYLFASGKIKLETSDDASSIELIVPDVPEGSKPKTEE